MSSNLCPRCSLRERKRYAKGLGPYCVECTKEYNAQKLAKKRHFLNEYKLERGCSQCGYKGHPVALELNHIDPLSKSINIARELASCSMERLEAELVKCEVLCANCHQIHTYENKHHLVRRS